MRTNYHHAPQEQENRLSPQPRATFALFPAEPPRLLPFLLQSHCSLRALRHTLMMLVLLCAVYVASCPQAVADSALNDLIAAQGSGHEVLSTDDIKVLQALSQSQNSKSRKLSSRPIVTAPGEVRFIYGASQPTVVCSLLHVCDIALEAGETVVDLKVGDSARWMVERSASGSDEGIIEHITIKPTDIGLLSNMRIYTDRRTYALNLKSSASEFMSSISFSYPEQSLKRFAEVKSLLRQSTQQYTTQVPNAQGDSISLLSNLNFNYELSGDEELYPLRVFNDGNKTYVQMPPNMLQGKLPALVAVTATHAFSQDDTSLTNYRLINNTFVVDGIPQHLRLILGNEQSTTPLSADITLQQS